MHTFADGLFEMELRKKHIEAELERAKWVRWAEEARPKTKRDWGIWRTAVSLRDRVLEVRCEVQTLFAAEPASSTC